MGQDKKSSISTLAFFLAAIAKTSGGETEP